MDKNYGLFEDIKVPEKQLTPIELIDNRIKFYYKSLETCLMFDSYAIACIIRELKFLKEEMKHGQV